MLIPFKLLQQLQRLPDGCQQPLWQPINRADLATCTGGLHTDVFSLLDTEVVRVTVLLERAAVAAEVAATRGLAVAWGSRLAALHSSA